MASGDKSRIYWSKAFESTFGTAVAGTLSFAITDDLSPAHTDEIDDQINGTIFQDRVTRTALMGSGSPSGQATSELLTALFKALMWTSPATTGAGDPYTHTWTDDTANGFGGTGSGVSVTKQIASISTFIPRFAGVIVPSLTISGGGSGKVNVSWNWQACGTIAATTEPVVSIPSEGYYVSKKSTLTVDATGGSSPTDISSRVSDFSITFNAGTELLPRIGSTSGEFVGADRGPRPTIEFSYTIDEGAVNEKSGHDDYAAGTFRKFILTLKGDSNRDCVITIAKARLMPGYPLRIGEHGVYKVQRKLECFYDSTLTPKIVSVAVRSGVTSY